MINYAPQLLNKQEAFITKNDQIIIKIALIDNYLASTNEISGYRLKMLSGYNNTTLINKDIEVNLGPNQNQTIEFIINSTELDFENLEGEYYRIQIAYIDSEGNSGIYSNTSVIKWAKLPEITLEKTENNKYVLFRFPYYGQDYEKLLSVQFKIYDEDKNLLEQSELLYNNYNTEEIQYEFNYYTTNVNNTTLLIRADYTTADNYNGYLEQEWEMTRSYPVGLDGFGTYAVVNTNNGYIQFNSTSIKGPIYRTSMDPLGSITSWDKISETGDFKDKNLIANKEYSYLFTNTSDILLYIKNILINYEDAYLFDNELDFKIKYNPKISSFKQVVQEQKIETIGAQYPFFFKNGEINYHEFPISGLISYIPSIEYEEEATYETNLTATNIAAEREYKMKVLKWLNNGKPKVFKSSTEGNFIVRLSGVSLIPEDKLGRMLHSFQCTATEIAEYNIKNLKKYNLM